MARESPERIVSLHIHKQLCISILSCRTSSNALLPEDDDQEHTLSASQTLTVLSKEDVARRDMLGLNLTSVIRNECSSNEDLGFSGSVPHKTTCAE